MRRKDLLVSTQLLPPPAHFWPLQRRVNALQLPARAARISFGYRHDLATIKDLRERCPRTHLHVLKLLAARIRDQLLAATARHRGNEVVGETRYGISENDCCDFPSRSGSLAWMRLPQTAVWLAHCVADLYWPPLVPDKPKQK